MAAQLPDFNTLAEAMRASANGLSNAATEMEKMPNIPVVDMAAQLNQILLELRDLRTGLGEVRTELREVRTELRDVRTDLRDLRRDFTRENRNNFARLLNSKVTNNTTPLEALLALDGQQIQGFPQTSADIHAMDNAAVNDLLIAFGLPVGGRINDRKNMIRQHIGLTVL
ncbi:hypothetical protein BDZ91DRAFT_745662 [Kalaharituber pfeilii]|nr:hypothetical protein BDZ91DRAFT_745662 [Kalaharituber pfeilii]